MKYSRFKSLYSGKKEISIITADTHNFGRSVFKINDKYIFKPRFIFWEWLFLESSPIRDLLDNNADGLFSCLPKLHFESNTSFIDGLVELFSCDRQANLKPVDLIQVGAIMALFCFFGVTDLHTENVIVGRRDGKFICGALDIETVFENVEFPAQTLLIPSKLVAKDNCGFSFIISKIQEKLCAENLLYIVDGYYRGLNFLFDNFEEIYEHLRRLIAQHNPIIRRILRSTKQYARFRDTFVEDNRFDEAEIKQISRGDIPYFFKFSTASDVYFFTNSKLEQITSIQRNSFDLETIESLNLADFANTSATRYKSLRKNGLLQILRLVPADCKTQLIKLNNFILSLSEREIFIEINQSERLRFRRIG